MIPLHLSDSKIAHMQAAIDIAKMGTYTVKGNPLVGCVLVKDNKIIAKGYHQIAGSDHAEVNAYSQLSDDEDLTGIECYVTLEPCNHQGKTPPCVDLLLEKRPSKIYVAMLDPNPKMKGASVQLLQEAGIEVEVGLLEQEAQKLNLGFIKRMQQGRPWVTLKVAASLDGKIALANGESKWVTEQLARQDVQRLRARSDAIVTGIGTVNKDNPNLSVRLDEWQFRPKKPDHGLELFLQSNIKNYPYPLKVVLDSKASIAPDAKIFNSDGAVLLLTEQAELNQFLKPKCEHLSYDTKSTQQKHSNKSVTSDLEPKLSFLLDDLADKEMNYLMVEAGTKLTNAFLNAGLVDELVYYVAPKLLGSTSLSAFDVEAPTKLAWAKQFKLELVEVFDHDVKMTYLKP